MKHIIIIVATAIAMMACNKSKPQVESTLASKQSVIDSMRMQSELQLTRQRIIDSVNLVSAQNKVVLNPIETPNAFVHTTYHSHNTHNRVTNNPPPAMIPNNNGTVPTDHTAVNINTVAAEATPEEKKKMSNKTKGALIGAAAGVITGAAAGAIINKENPLQGGIIGGVLGGAIGSGVGYGGGNASDNKKAKEDSAANANKKP